MTGLSDIKKNYALTSDIPNFGFVTDGDLDNILDEYAKSSEIPTYTSQLTNNSGFITSIPDEYVTNDDLNNYQKKIFSIGDETEPVYINADGDFKTCNVYAGGTVVTLNNSDKGASTASFYAPTTGGDTGTVLMGNGSTSEPSWTKELRYINSIGNTQGDLTVDSRGTMTIYGDEGLILSVGQGDIKLENSGNGTLVGNLNGKANSADNIAGGSAGNIPYQTGEGQTSFISTPTDGNGHFLKNKDSNGYSWELITSDDITYTGKSISGLTNLSTGCLTIGHNKIEETYYDKYGSNLDISSNLSSLQLAINGGVKINGALTVDGTIKASGSITPDSTISDIRDKIEINYLNSALNFVKQLKPITYRYNMRSEYNMETEYNDYLNGTKKEKNMRAGFVAQEVKETIEKEYNIKIENNPIIRYNKNKDIYGIDLQGLTAYLTLAIQEQQKMIENLQLEIVTLKEQINK